MNKAGHYMTVIVTRNQGEHAWWGEEYAFSADADAAILRTRDAYEEAARMGYDDFECAFGCFDTNDVSAFEVWKIDWRVEARDPDALFREQSELEEVPE